MQTNWLIFALLLLLTLTSGVANVHSAAAQPPENAENAGAEQTSEKRTDETAAKETAADQPAKDKPAADTPAADKPATDKPATDKPATDSPATDSPATDSPATDSPATDSPATDSPATDSPATDSPATDKPATDSPATDSPATDSPATDKPAADTPAADKPASDKPASDKPAADTPAAGDTTAGDAPAEPPEDPPPEEPPPPDKKGGGFVLALMAIGIITALVLTWRRFFWKGRPAENRNIIRGGVSRTSDADSNIPRHADLQLESDVVRSLFGMHGVLYRFLANRKRHSYAAKLANLHPEFRNQENFIETFLQSIEGEIERNGFDIIKPAVGERINPMTMETTESVDCVSDEDANCVAKVYLCGFRPVEGRGWEKIKHKVQQKSQVAVYRKKHDSVNGGKS